MIALAEAVQANGTVNVIQSSFPTRVTVGPQDEPDGAVTYDPARLVFVRDPVEPAKVICIVLYDTPGSKSSQPPEVVVSERITSGFKGRANSGMVQLADWKILTWTRSHGCGCGARLKSGRYPWDQATDGNLRVMMVSDRPWRAAR